MQIHPFVLLVVATLVTSEKRNFLSIQGCDYVLDETTIKIEGCRAVNLENGQLQKNITITTISISNSFNVTIQDGAFEKLPLLTDIVIEDSYITEIGPTAFNLVELKTVAFKNARFAAVPKLSSEYLEELIFDNCQLTEVPNVDNLKGLDFLNLQNNLIEGIDALAFKQANYLGEINLANNSITNLPADLFSNIVELSTLTLDYNPLVTFNLNLPGNVELLSLQHCGIRFFDKTTAEKITAVSTLFLNGNEISNLPFDAFEPMKDLTTLDLSDNKLVELDDTIFDENDQLDEIILDNNHFEKLPSFTFNGGESFKVTIFSCKNCGLTSVDGVFDEMKTLVKINLSDNKLPIIDEIFNEMPGLQELILANNRIKIIPAMPQAGALLTLDVSNNPLLPLDPIELATMPSLKKLNVSSSNLTKLWDNYDVVIPKLQKLFVDNNQLISIRPADVKILPDLILIDLRNNHLVCTKALTDFVDYIKSKKVSLNGPLSESLIIEPKADADVIQSVFPLGCISSNSFDDDDFDNSLADDYNEEEDYEDEESDAYQEEDETDDTGVAASVLNDGSFNLAKASYILSITSVFILTALLVLFVAVVITLLILKRNRALNMHGSNLPRVKIPLWHSTLTQKKHSGSIYRPLSEEFTGSHYDFKQIPQVHNNV